MSSDTLSGGVAVITGAGGGIGAGLAREAVGRGMRVALADRDKAALEEVRASLGDDAIAIVTDVTDPASLTALADAVYGKFGQVDLLFNNAGVLSTGMSWEIPAETWRRALDVNVMGVVNGLTAFVPRLLAARRPARIVNTASVGGFLPSPLMAPYSASKFAVVALTEALAGEFKILNAQVEVSLLAPGPVKTGIMRDQPPTAAAGFHQAMVDMQGRFGLSGDEFAHLVFNAIERGDYWIIPQPEALEPGWSIRNQAIAERRKPQFFMVEDKQQ